MFRVLISSSYMRWRLGNSIRLKCQNRFAALENINRAWENIKEYIKISAKETLVLYELAQHKPCFDEECSQSLGQRKQAQMQWLHDPNQHNVDNLNNARHEASRHFRNKKGEYLKAKSNELEINSNNNNVREL
jgi:hypothetical protein